MRVFFVVEPQGVHADGREECVGPHERHQQSEEIETEQASKTTA